MGDPRELVRRYYETFDRHDLDAYGEHFTPGVRVSASGGLEAEGIEAMRAFDGSWFEGFPDCTVTIERMVVEGSTVVCVNRFEGTHTGTLRTPAGDIPATGVHGGDRYIALIELEGDRIAALTAILDRLALVEQLGLMPAPANA
jgi:predicted ester cyclase